MTASKATEAVPVATSMSARPILISVMRNKNVRIMTGATVANVKMGSTNQLTVFVWTSMNAQLILINVH